MAVKSLNRKSLESDIRKHLGDETSERIGLAFNRSLRRFSTMGIGGTADCIAYPESLGDIISLVEFSRESDQPIYVIGRGSNTIFGNIDGILIQTNKMDKIIGINGEPVQDEETLESVLNGIREGDYVDIEVEAGLFLGKLSRFGARYGLEKLEFGIRIPGNIGGAVVMNAAVVDMATKRIVDYVVAVNPKGERVKISKEDLSFRHRYSSLQDKYEDYIVYSVGLRLRKGDKEKIQEYTGHIADLRTNQTRGLSVGSFWIRRGYVIKFDGHGHKCDPNEAAFYLDDLMTGCTLECRGWSSNNGKVHVADSDKNVSFLIAKRGATVYDVVQIAKRCYDAVMDTYGVPLRLEVKFVGVTNKGLPLHERVLHILEGHGRLSDYRRELMIPRHSADRGTTIAKTTSVPQASVPQITFDDKYDLIWYVIEECCNGRNAQISDRLSHMKVEDYPHRLQRFKAILPIH